MTDATPQAALLSEAIKLANEFRVTMPREVLAIWGAEVQAELRRLDALVAHLTADRDERAAFEQWASDNGEFPRAVARSGDLYHLMATQTYWLAWQARAALSARKPLPYDLICNAIDLADTESMKGDYMLDSSDCIAVVRTMQALIEINGIGLEVKP